MDYGGESCNSDRVLEENHGTNDGATTENRSGVGESLNRHIEHPFIQSVYPKMPFVFCGGKMSYLL
jgi:hypothetical protein